jgi:hypothetical protein
MKKFLVIDCVKRYEYMFNNHHRLVGKVSWRFLFYDIFGGSTGVKYVVFGSQN